MNNNQGDRSWQGAQMNSRFELNPVAQRPDNAIEYMRQRRKELGRRIMELAALQRELADIDKALAALGDGGQ